MRPREWHVQHFMTFDMHQFGAQTLPRNLRHSLPDRFNLRMICFKHIEADVEAIERCAI